MQCSLPVQIRVLHVRMRSNFNEAILAPALHRFDAQRSDLYKQLPALQRKPRVSLHPLQSGSRGGQRGGGGGGGGRRAGLCTPSAGIVFWVAGRLPKHGRLPRAARRPRRREQGPACGDRDFHPISESSCEEVSQLKADLNAIACSLTQQLQLEACGVGERRPKVCQICVDERTILYSTSTGFYTRYFTTSTHYTLLQTHILYYLVLYTILFRQLRGFWKGGGVAGGSQNSGAAKGSAPLPWFGVAGGGVLSLAALVVHEYSIM